MVEASLSVSIFICFKPCFVFFEFNFFNQNFSIISKFQLQIAYSLLRSEKEKEILFHSLEAANKELAEGNKAKQAKCEFLQKRAVDEATKLDAMIKLVKVEAAKCQASLAAANHANATSRRLKERSEVVASLMTSLNAKSSIVTDSINEAKHVIEKVRAIKELSSALKGRLAEDLALIEKEITTLTENSASFEKERGELQENFELLQSNHQDLTGDLHSIETEFRHNQAIYKEASVVIPRLMQRFEEKKKELQKVSNTHAIAVAKEVNDMKLAELSKKEAIEKFNNFFNGDIETKAKISSLTAEAKQLTQSCKAICDETDKLLIATSKTEKLIESTHHEKNAAQEKLEKLMSGKGSSELHEKAKGNVAQSESDVKAALDKSEHLNRACTLADDMIDELKLSTVKLHQTFIDLLSSRICGVDREDAESFHKISRQKLVDSLLSSSSSSSSAANKKETSSTGDDDENDELMFGVKSSGNTSTIESIVNDAVSQCNAFTIVQSKDDEWNKALLAVHSSALNAITQKKMYPGQAATSAASGEGRGGDGGISIGNVKDSDVSAHPSSSKNKAKDVISGRRTSSAGILENGMTQICTYRGYQGFVDECRSLVVSEMIPLIDSLQAAICFNDVDIKLDSAGEVEIETTPYFKIMADNLLKSYSAAVADVESRDSKSAEIIKLREEISSFEERIKVAVNETKSAEAKALAALESIEAESKALDTV
jgi:hypothetical protein